MRCKVGRCSSMNPLEYRVERRINGSIIRRNRRADACRLLREGGIGCDKLAESPCLRGMLPLGQLLDGKPVGIGVDQPPAILAKPESIFLAAPLLRRLGRIVARATGRGRADMRCHA